MFTVHRRNTRRATPSITQHINADFDAHIESKKTWQAIRTLHPDAAITMQDVRNQRHHYSSLLDEGLPTIQALIRGLDSAWAY